MTCIGLRSFAPRPYHVIVDFDFESKYIPLAVKTDRLPCTFFRDKRVRVYTGCTIRRDVAHGTNGEYGNNEIQKIRTWKQRCDPSSISERI